MKRKEKWKRIGCSILSYGWSDSRRRPLLNILIQYLQGAMFIKSIVTSNEVKTSQFIFKFLEAAILEVGEEHVVQVVTNNATNCKGESELLMEMFPHLFWTPCS